MAYVAKDESSLGINYFEYNVEKKPDGKTRLQRIGIVIIDIVLAIGILAISPAGLVPIMFCGFGLLFAILTFFLYKRTQVEYEYEINSGELTMAKIYGGRSRKNLFSQKISAFEIIAPYTEDKLKEATRGTEAKIYNCTSSPDALDMYFGIFKDESGNKCAVILQAPKKAVSIFRFYNSSATQIK